MSETIQISNVVLGAFPAIFKPSEATEMFKSQYQINVYLYNDEHEKDISNLFNKIDIALDGVQIKRKDISSNFMFFKQVPSVIENLEGDIHVIKCRSSIDRPPSIFNSGGTKITMFDNGLFIPGSIVNIIIKLYPYNSKKGKGISANFEAIQFVKKGPVLLGQRNDYSDVFSNTNNTQNTLDESNDDSPF